MKAAAFEAWHVVRAQSPYRHALAVPCITAAKQQAPGIRQLASSWCMAAMFSLTKHTVCALLHALLLLPQMATGYYVPSLFVHFFTMFGPGILFGSTYHRLMLLLVLVSGPFMSEVVVWGGGQAVRRLEWASIWCLFSAAQVSTLAAAGDSRVMPYVCALRTARYGKTSISTPAEQHAESPNPWMQSHVTGVPLYQAATHKCRRPVQVKRVRV
jgi:hypothetical protein